MSFAVAGGEFPEESFRFSRVLELAYRAGRDAAYSGMSLKETIAVFVSLAAVFGAYAAVVEWVLHLELVRLGSGLL